MNEKTQIHIAGMSFTESQMEALRAWFKAEWQRKEIREAICVIMEVLACHNGSEPDDEADQKISHLLLDQDIKNDIVDRFYHSVPEWNEEALRTANEYDAGVWRSLYDIIVPEMRAKLRDGEYRKERGIK